MYKLANNLSKEDALKKISAESFSRRTLSFYRYVKIADPRTLRDTLYREWSALGALGRIYVSQEGVNAQMNIPEPHYQAFLENLESHREFQSMPLKPAVEQPTESFWKLTIKVKHQIVADGLAPDTYNIENVGTHVNAEEFNRLASEPDTLIVDMRNAYESEIGHFENALCPDIDTFKDELPLVSQTLQDQKSKKLLLYCTGGIRCEKASAYLKNEGFTDVYQLYGGIINYAHEVRAKNLPSKFKGKNFVFDERRAERITDDILSHCHQCAAPADTHVNCANEMCNILFIQCATCTEKMSTCCSEKCQVIYRLPEHDQKLLRKHQTAKPKMFNKRGRMLSCMVSLLILIIMPFSTSAFSDVKEQTAYSYEINWLADNGVVRGYGDGKFYPEQCVRRAEFLKMMYKTLESDTVPLPAVYLDGKTYFSDVNTSAWYGDYVLYALRRGSVQGYSDKTFRPDQCVNRVEAVKMAVLEFNDGKSPYWDSIGNHLVDVAHDAWYSPMLNYAHAAGALGLAHTKLVREGPPGDSGSDYAYYPDGGMTRGEVAYLLFTLKSFKDNGVIAQDSSQYDKEKVLYNDERGMLMPKQLSVAYTFDGCGKTSKYESSSWWKSLQNGATASGVDLSKTADMCFSPDANVVIFMTESVIASVPKSNDLPEGIFLSKIKVHKFTASTGKLEDPVTQGVYTFDPSDIRINTNDGTVEFGKRIGDFIVIRSPSHGEYHEYYFGKNILKGSYKMTEIVD